MGKVKILQVGRDVVDTGAGRVILETSREMTSSGHEIRLLTDTHIDRLKDVFVSIEYTPFGQILKDWTPKTRAGRVLRHTLQILVFAIWGTLRARYWSKKGWIVFNHNLEVLCGDVLVLHNVFRAEHIQDDRPFFRKNLRWFNPVFTIRIFREHFLLNRSHSRLVCAVSKVTAKEAEQYVARELDVMTIPNGVNTEVFLPIDPGERKRLRTADGSADFFILLFVAHEFEKKGLRLLIEALALLPDQVRLKVIGGRSSNQAGYEKFAGKLGIRKRIDFLGTRLKTTIHYQLADLFVFPSAYEAFALVGLEAMSCGTPALMTDVGGVTGYLKHGENGFIINRDPEDIAQKVRLLLHDHHVLAAMRKNARNTALGYSWNSIANQYLDLAQQVTKNKVPGA
jgi:UDP-glucose:(heptosyl)LPS alpha-1,3-glucosyltransferase